MIKYKLRAGTPVKRWNEEDTNLEEFVTTVDAYYYENEISNALYEINTAIIDLPQKAWPYRWIKVSKQHLIQIHEGPSE